MYEDCVNQTGIELLIDERESKQTLYDFGGLVKGNSPILAKPESVEQLQALVRYAHKKRLKLIARGYGNSQSGQSLANENTITISFDRLDSVCKPVLPSQSITCCPGASWRAVCAQTWSYHLAPYVLPYNLDLSVGGTISIGGLGSASPFYGICASHVIALQAVLATGELVTCSDNERSDLFYAILSGVGRFALIASVTLALKQVKPKVKTIYLLYDNHEYWLEDQLNLQKNKTCNYIESFCTPCMQGFRHINKQYEGFNQWFFTLRLSLEYDVGEYNSIKSLIANLRYYQHTYIENISIEDYTIRHDMRLDLYKKSPYWKFYHPWIEAVLPYHKLKKILLECLHIMPSLLASNCHVFPLARCKIPKYFMLPPEDDLFVFTYMLAGIDQAQIEDLLPRVKLLDELIRKNGGKRYLSGWFHSTDETFFKSHFQDCYHDWQATKKKYDPENIFSSLFFEKIDDLS